MPIRYFGGAAFVLALAPAAAHAADEPAASTGTASISDHLKDAAKSGAAKTKSAVKGGFVGP